VANLVSRLTTASKVVWGRTSIEVNLLSRILLRISLTEPKAKSKKMSPTNPVEEEEKAEAEVEVEPRPEKEEENFGKASPQDIIDTHLLPFPHQAKKHVEDEKFSRFVEVIWGMYVHIPMLDAIQVLTYTRYLKDILN
jgi:hypothetical protein